MITHQKVAGLQWWHRILSRLWHLKRINVFANIMSHLQFLFLKSNNFCCFPPLFFIIFNYGVFNFLQFWRWRVGEKIGSSQESMSWRFEGRRFFLLYCSSQSLISNFCNIVNMLLPMFNLAPQHTEKLSFCILHNLEGEIHELIQYAYELLLQFIHLNQPASLLFFSFVGKHL